MLSEKLTGIGNREPLSRTADALFSLAGEACPTGNRNLGRDSVVYDLKEIYRMSRLRGSARRIVLDQRKRPTISKSRIQTDVERIARLINCSKSLAVRRVAPNTYCIRDAAA